MEDVLILFIIIIVVLLIMVSFLIGSLSANEQDKH